MGKEDVASAPTLTEEWQSLLRKWPEQFSEAVRREAQTQDPYDAFVNGEVAFPRVSNREITFPVNHKPNQAQGVSTMNAQQMIDTVRGQMLAGGAGGAVGCHSGEAASTLPDRRPAQPAPFGAPFITVTHPQTYTGQAFQLTSGVVVVKIGCQTRLLTDWEANAREHSAVPNGNESLLGAFLALVRAAAPETAL